MVEIHVNNHACFIAGSFSDDPLYSSSVHNEIKKALSYKVPNHEWSEKFKQGIWDGTISIYNRRLGQFPTGLLYLVTNLLTELKVEFKIVDNRKRPPKVYPLTLDLGNRTLRDYQKLSAEKFAETGTGILALATGAGKTLTSCYLFTQIQTYPVVFIVPALELLNQTQKEFEKYLRLDGKPVKVGKIGGGVVDINMQGINVCTYQTILTAYNKKYNEKQYKIVDTTDGDGPKTTEQLQKELDVATKKWTLSKKNAERDLSKLSLEIENTQKLLNSESDLKKIKTLSTSVTNLEKRFTKEFNALVKTDLAAYKKAQTAWDNRQKILFEKSQVRDLISSCKGFIVDEAHLAAVVVEELRSYAQEAYYCGGMSATPYRTDNQEIRIEGALGGKIYEVSNSDLIDRKFLVPPKIFMVEIEEFTTPQTYADAYDENIVNSWERNYRIKQFAESFKSAGLPVLILVERREHGSILESMIEDAVFVPGGDKGEIDPTDEEKNYRRRMLNAVENNEIVLIATQWANTGVDAPKIATLIIAGSCSSPVTTYQQVGRVLRCVGRDANESTLNGKPYAVVIDFYDQHKNLKTHSNMRKRVYRFERSWDFKMIKAT
jgi:superfamily II DNA or RNA helicase